MALQRHRVLSAVVRQQRSVQLIGQLNARLIWGGRVSRRRDHKHRRQILHGDGMRLARGWHRPECAGAQRRVTGELAVAHERRHLAQLAVLFDHLGAVSDRRAVDAIHRRPNIRGVAVVAFGVAFHVLVGKPEHLVAVAVHQFRQGGGQIRPQRWRVQRQDGADDRVGIGQSARVRRRRRLVHQRVDQTVVDIHRFGGIVAQWTVRRFRAVRGVVVERLLKGFGLADVGLEWIGIGVYRAVEHHRAHVLRIRLGVRGADAGSVGVTEVGQLLITERGPQHVKVFGDSGGADVGQELFAHLVDAALHEIFGGLFDVCNACRAVVDLRIGALLVVVGVGVTPHLRLGQSNPARIEADQIETFLKLRRQVLGHRRGCIDSGFARAPGVDHQRADLRAGSRELDDGNGCGSGVGLGVVDRYAELAALRIGQNRIRLGRGSHAVDPSDRRPNLQYRELGSAVDEPGAADDSDGYRRDSGQAASSVHGSTCCHDAASSSDRPTEKASAKSHKSGSNSGHEMIPMSSLPFSDITVIFRPEPWKMGPSGYIALTSAPRKYNGTCGPGTLDITRLCTGRLSVSRLLEYARIAIPNTAGAANWDQSCSSVAAIAELCSLAVEFALAMALSRSAGSAMCVSSRENMPDTWFRPGRSDFSRTETGTIATKGSSGRSPRSRRYCRRTPAHSAITTSLSLTSNRFFTVLISSRSSSA